MPGTVFAAVTRAYKIYWCTLIVLGTCFFAVSTDDRGRDVSEPVADGAYYYAYLPSVLLDRDFDFTNQYEVTKNRYSLKHTANGMMSNVFGIGPAVFQSPAFIVGHGLALATDSRLDGFSRWETWLSLWTAVPYTLGALFFAAKLARRRIGPGITSTLGPLVAALAGPVCYYALRQPGYAHPYATFCVAWLVETWDASYDGVAPRSLRTWLVLGVAMGAAALARPQLLTWSAVLAFAAIDDIRRRDACPVRTIIGRWACGALVCCIVFSPQLIAWKCIYDAWYVVPQGAGFMRWDAPAWSEVLFSSRNGLFPWAPLYPIFFGGLFFYNSDIVIDLSWD